MADNKILLIEKDTDTYQRLSGVLTGMGYSTEQAKDEVEAGNLAQGGTFYAIFINISTMPDIKEIEHIKTISKPYSIIVVMGDNSQNSTIAKALEIGVDEFFHIPFDEALFSLRTKMVFDRVISERKKSTSYLNSLVDIIPAMMIITDGAGKILNANFAAIDKFHKTCENCKGSMIGEFINCSKAQKPDIYCHENCGFCKIYEYEQEAFNTGKSNIRREYTYKRLSNNNEEDKTLRVSVAPIDYNGQKAVIINLEDISFERNSIRTLTDTLFNLQQSYTDSQDKAKGSQEFAKYLQDINDNLQRERNKLQQLFANMSSGFLLLKRDENGNLIIADGNSKLEQMFNVKAKDYIDNGLFAKVADCDPKFAEAIGTVLETGEPQHQKIYAEQYDRWFNIDMYMPEHEYVAIIISDITKEEKSQKKNRELTYQLKKQNVMLDDKIMELRENEQLIKDQNAELQKAIDTKNKFISIIAHDLRNPFNAINGLSEMLEKKLNQAGDERCHEMAKIINDSGKSAYELLNNLLVWARSQQNTIQFAPERFDVHPAVSETIKEIKVQGDKKHIMLLNNTEQDDTIWADKQMFQTIVRNITSNAIKFTNENGLVVINSQMKEDSTVIEIEDNGVGMSQETIDKLMVVSKNKSTPGTAGEKGSGMGLLISKEFIDKHHGTVKVESEIGKGSKFIITFPATDTPKLADN